MLFIIMKTNIYKLEMKKGLDDLKPIYAFRGNSQGDKSATNSINTYKNSGGWMSFIFDCPLEQAAIDKQVEKNRLWNDNYIKELQKEGRYLEEYEISIELVHNPLFDDDDFPKPSCILNLI